MFRLSEFAEPLRQWLDKKVIYPEHFENIVRSWLDEGLPDLSISRSKERLRWGIQVPGDENQIVYTKYVTTYMYILTPKLFIFDRFMFGWML